MSDLTNEQLAEIDHEADECVRCKELMGIDAEEAKALVAEVRRRRAEGRHLEDAVMLVRRLLRRPGDNQLSEQAHDWLRRNFKPNILR